MQGNKAKKGGQPEGGCDAEQRGYINAVGNFG